MRIDLSERTVIVTGAGRGIGRAIAEMAGEAGARVVLVARSPEPLEEVAAHVREAGGEALVHPADLTDPATPKAVVKAARDAFGRVDGLVNNAGANLVGSLMFLKDPDIESLYELNTLSVIRMCREVMRPMIRAKYGRIVNITSVAAQLGSAHNSVYSSSKAAVDSFTKAIAKENAKLNITANVVSPWHAETELLMSSMAKRAKMYNTTLEDYLAKIIANNPIGRLLTVREVAAPVLFLLSDHASGINGQILRADGGY